MIGARLTPVDEPFLEAALDDRAKAVRRRAAELLAALPSSRLAQRMADRVRPLISKTRVRGRLEVEFPDEPDEAARRDGIVDEGAPPGSGLRAWWLIQLVAATPLGSWSQDLGRRPLTQPELVVGWCIAAVRQRDAGWAAALLRSLNGVHDTRLLAVLPPDQAQSALPPVLEKCNDVALASLLAAVPGPWPLPLSRAVIRRMRSAKSKVTLPAALAVLATAADPGVTPELDRWIADLAGEDHLRRQVGQVAHTLSIRQAIAEAFS